jgi:DNA invertase Pin-like site-specific DNA recombinase
MDQSQANRGGRPLAATPFQIEKVRRLRAGGLSLRAIARRVGVSFQTVRTIARDIK